MTIRDDRCYGEYVCSPIGFAPGSVSRSYDLQNNCGRYCNAANNQACTGTWAIQNECSPADVPGCNGLNIFGSMGMCEDTWSMQDVANEWCRRKGGGNAVSWTNLAEPSVPTYELCYLYQGENGPLENLEDGIPTTYPNYGCGGDCKCITDLVCGALDTRITKITYDVWKMIFHCISSRLMVYVLMRHSFLRLEFGFDPIQNV